MRGGPGYFSQSLPQAGFSKATTGVESEGANTTSHMSLEHRPTDRVLPCIIRAQLL